MKIEELATPKIQTMKVKRPPKVGTKQARAVDLLRGMKFETREEKAACIHLVMSELKMTKNGGTTYAYNAMRMLAAENANNPLC